MVHFISSQYMIPLCLISTVRYRLLKNLGINGEPLKLTVGKYTQFRCKLLCCTTKYGSSRHWVTLLYISRTLSQWFVCTSGMWNGLLLYMLLCGLILLYIVWIFSFVHFKMKCIEKVYAQCQFLQCSLARYEYNVCN